jgi:hypothetical protein
MATQLRGMGVRVVLGVVTLGALASAAACGRTSSSESGQAITFPNAKHASTTGDSGHAGQLACDGLCAVHAKAASLESLCVATVAAAKSVVGAAQCATRRAAGFPAIAASAVTDAALVELTPAGKTEHVGFLALKTAAGWQLARPVGTGASLVGGPVSPVDVPGLAPAGVQVQVAVSDDAGKSERMFVCGVTGEGAVHCPVALEIASDKAVPDQIAAFARGASDSWKVAVELTPHGYVATRVAGVVPAGLAGEHGWDSLPR